MKKELDNYLCRKYPDLYRDRHADTKPTAMHWGFACGNGWFSLIDLISELLVKHNANIKAEQVKEKFGGLNFYHSVCDEYSISIQMAALLVSKAACEECGAPALLQQHDGWYATLCKEHRNEDDAVNDKDIDLSAVGHLDLGVAWLRLAAILMRLAEFNCQHNGMLHADLTIFKDQHGRFDVQYSGGDEKTRGMVDLIVGYANRIDEHTGAVILTV
jgi:hypothetical protein